MPLVKLKGLDRAVKRLADGTTRTYWYAWRGGPRLEGKPGSPEFMGAYNRAIEARKTPSADTLAALVARYKASPEWLKNADSTKAHWSIWLDRICDKAGDKAIGDLTFKMLDDRRSREEILEWRDQWGDRPRQADYAMQVLSRVLSWGVSRGLLTLNVAAGVEQLYRSDRADIIWTEPQIKAFEAAAGSPEVRFILQLACLTGMRREDLATLSWSHVGEVAIVRPTAKGRGRRIATIPLLPATKVLLATIRAQQDARWSELAAVAAKKRRPEPPRATTVLSNTRGKPWSVNGLEHQVIDAKARIADAPHLHDARGTFATRLRRGGLKASQIADILGWDEARVERLLAVYVDRDRIVLDIAEQLNRNENGA